MPSLVRCCWPICAVWVLFAGGLPAWGQSAEPPAKRFAAADADGDKKISRDEFLKLPGEPAVLARDFRLFDFDGNQSLSPEEFDAAPLGRPAAERGALPDPFAEILTRALAQLDEAYDQWDQNPKRNVNVNDFVQSFLLSFPDQNRVVNDPGLLQRDADANRNNRITRDEAKRFLEIQLGLRRSDGELLRLPNGRVVLHAIFLALDIDQNLAIDRAEFLARWWHKDKLDEHWKLLDQNQDNRVDVQEFQHPQWFGVDDPVETFRAYDQNLNAFVDAQELLAGSPEWNQKLAKHAFPAFDLDGDQQLSLWEFRQLPQVNLVFPWNGEYVDASRDGVLQFHEFTAHQGLFPLLRLVYFHRYDVNRDGVLDPQEFPFKVWPPEALYRLNADGTDWKLVFSSENYPVVGSPKLSSDGKWLLCDAIKRNQQGGGRVMLLMTSDGQKVRELGSGMMPNFSPDGKQITFSRAGVEVMNLETNQVRSLVPNGWSAQWSPAENRIAYTLGAGLQVIDAANERVTEILTQADTPYQQIFWNIGWSADGKRICFKGVRKNGRSEIASVSVAEPPDLQVHYEGDRVFSNAFSWSPDGKRIVFAMHSTDAPRMLMHELNPETNAEPILLKGPDTSRQSHDSCWSHDGKFLIIDTRAD